MIKQKERLTIDVLPDEHKKIKLYATIHGKTIRDFVLETIRDRLKEENENKELLALTTNLSQDSVLKELWDNEIDAGYDKL